MIRAAIAARIDDAVAVDEDAWDTYGLRPLQLVGGPQSPFLDRLADAVERNLDYEITGQNADGSWRPNWTWGDAYPTTWQRAKAEWTSVVTLEHLMRLEAFGRIEGRD